MRQTIQQLQTRLNERLEAISRENDPVMRSDLSLKEIEATIGELKAYTGKHEFASGPEEIRYFRETLPSIFSRHIYFTKIYHVEVKKKIIGSRQLRKMMQKALKDIDRYNKENIEFYNFYYKFSGQIDDQVFTRKHGNRWIRDEFSPFIDNTIPLATYKLSFIIAGGLYRQFLEQELSRLDNASAPADKPVQTKYTFHGTKSALAEACVCAFLSEAIYLDGKPVTLTQIVQAVSEVFNTDLKDFKNLDYANRMHKKDLAPFMNTLIKKYSDRADRLNA